MFSNSSLLVALGNAFEHLRSLERLGHGAMVLPWDWDRGTGPLLGHWGFWGSVGPQKWDQFDSFGPPDFDSKNPSESVAFVKLSLSDDCKNVNNDRL